MIIWTQHCFVGEGALKNNIILAMVSMYFVKDCRFDLGRTHLQKWVESTSGEPGLVRVYTTKN